MTESDLDRWMEENKRYLLARVYSVRDRLRMRTQGNAEHTAPSVVQWPATLPAPPQLDTLCGVFGLSTFERDVLLMCAGMELDSRFAQACTDRSDGAYRYPTFSLALAALPDAHWSALNPSAPLRYWRLIDIQPGDGLVTSRLRIDERILHYLTGVCGIDERLQGLLGWLTPAGTLVPSHDRVCQRLLGTWSEAGRVLIQLNGPDVHAKREIAAHLCARLMRPLYVLRGTDIPEGFTEREALARLWQRESALAGCVLLIDCGIRCSVAAAALIEQVAVPTLVAVEEPLRLPGHAIASVHVARPSQAEQRDLWIATLGDYVAGCVHALSAQFDMAEQDIRSVSAEMLNALADVPPEREFEAKLWSVCCSRTRHDLAALAERIEPVADWSDLVLPSAQMNTLRAIVAQVRHRAQVYDIWGFASKGARGLGVSALFAGASGTGKTMAAEIVARELRLDLYKVDLSRVVSKYIGETEKNLARIFDAAEASGAVLLFDEADALFGRRSEVRDSHDRYANIEVSYLLQRMESYRGLAILTTNMKNMLDSAFMRRLRFIVQFPAPDTAQRAHIWRSVFPQQLPLQDIDVTKLAKLNIAGGNIRNIAMQAAFLAAEKREPVRMQHLLHAARSECAKVDRQIADLEVKDWV